MKEEERARMQRARIRLFGKLELRHPDNRRGLSVHIFRAHSCSAGCVSHEHEAISFPLVFLLKPPDDLTSLLPSNLSLPDRYTLDRVPEEA